MGKRLHRNIVIRGKTFATVQDAAKACGVTVGAIYSAKRKGRLDNVGLGITRPDAMSIQIRDMRFADAKAAGAHFGVTAGAIRQALCSGRIDRVGLKPVYGVNNTKPVRIGDRSYPSMNAAGRALGFPAGYVSKALRSGRTTALERLASAAMRLEADQAAMVRSVREGARAMTRTGGADAETIPG